MPATEDRTWSPPATEKQIEITACSELVTAHREEETMARQHRLQDEDTACQEDHLGMLKPECHSTFIRTGFTPNRSVSLLSESDTAANLDRSPLGCQRPHAAKHSTHHVGDISHHTAVDLVRSPQGYKDHVQQLIMSGAHRVSKDHVQPSIKLNPWKTVPTT